MNTPRASRNIFVRIWNFFWGTITWLRIILVNLIFLVFLAIIISSILETAPKPINQPGPLFIAPSGQLVDQLSYQPPLSALTGDTAPETDLRSLITSIKYASDDDRVTGLIIKLDDLAGGGMSKIQELGQAIERFKTSNKPVVAYGNLFSQQQYYLASYANTIFVHDMGGVGITGFGMYRNYFKGLIDKLGINVHVFRSGTFKDFVEPYIRSDMSAASRTHNEEWLNTMWATYTGDIEQRRGLEKGSLDSYIKNLPSLLNEYDGETALLAKNVHLVDEIGSKQMLIEFLIEKFGRNEEDGNMFNFIDEHDYGQELALSNFQKTGNIGLIVATGTIHDGDQPEGAIGGDSLSRLIRKARYDDALKALVIRVDSGGGSAFASELIRQEIAETQQAGKPVFISMGSIAASGGYWLATGANEIWATPTTLTGSIGVFSIVPTFEKTLEKVGVTSDGIATSELAGIFQLDRPMSEQSKAVMQLGVDSVYGKFLKITASARNSSVEEIRKVAEGRVWLGEQAQSLNLVDQLGSLDDVIAATAKFANISQPKVILVERDLTPFEQILKSIAINTQASFKALGILQTNPSQILFKNLAADINQLPVVQILAEQSRHPQQPLIFAFCSDCLLK
jgi:protease-4